jgi:hypothetical protein
LPDEIVHPYLGFVRQPNGTTFDGGLRANELGFPGQELPLHQRGGDRLIVGILGGSVAEQFSTVALEEFEAQLRKSRFFSGKRLIFAPLALSGYKQPQQLMTVNYLLSLGAEFDVLINLDGYNEVVLPPVENVPAHVFPSYPRGWSIRISEAGDTAVLRAVGRVAVARERIEFWARWVRRSPLRYSPAANLAWRFIHSADRRALFREFRALHALEAQRTDYAAKGPGDAAMQQPDVHEHCASIWRRSSLQLHQLCQANRIHYFHFLQPNQYVPGAKPMGQLEKLRVVAQGHAGQKHVMAGYPLLVRDGRELAERGVAFTDLTMVFADYPEQTYSDTCCHLNERGNAILAQKMAAVIAAALPSEQ